NLPRGSRRTEHISLHHPDYGWNHSSLGPTNRIRPSAWSQSRSSDRRYSDHRRRNHRGSHPKWLPLWCAQEGLGCSPRTRRRCRNAGLLTAPQGRELHLLPTRLAVPLLLVAFCVLPAPLIPAALYSWARTSGSPMKSRDSAESILPV